MNLHVLQDVNCDYLLDELKGKEFFAIEIKNGNYRLHIPGHIIPTQVIFGAELVKHHMLNRCIDRYEEDLDEEA